MLDPDSTCPNADGAPAPTAWQARREWRMALELASSAVAHPRPAARGRRATATPSSCCPASSPDPSRPSSCAATCAASATAPTTGARAATSAPAPGSPTGSRTSCSRSTTATAQGEPGRLERRRHLRPRDGPRPARLHPLGHHPRQPVPRPPRVDPRLDDVPPHEPAPPREDVHRGGPRPARRHRCSVPTTCIYSRTDGIVAWECCVSEPAPQTENIEVHATHLGYGHEYETLRVIADRLAQPEGAGCRMPYAGLRRRRRARHPPAGRRDGTTRRPHEHGRRRAARRADAAWPARAGRHPWTRSSSWGRRNETLMHVGVDAALHAPAGCRSRTYLPDLLADAARRPDRAALEPAPADPDADAPARAPLGRGRRVRHRLPRAALGAAEPRRRARARRARLAAALQPARLPPAAVGAARHRGPVAAAGSRSTSKIHHSLVDGYTGMRMLQRGLSPDPDDREHPFFFSLTKPPAPAARGRPGRRLRLDPARAGRRRSARRRRWPRPSSRPSCGAGAPRPGGDVATRRRTRSSTSGSGESRRFATQQYELARLRAIARARGRHPQRRAHGDLRRRAAPVPHRPAAAPRAPAHRLHPRQRAAQGERGRRQRRRAPPSSRWRPTSRTRWPAWPRSRHPHGRRRRGCAG